MTQEEIHKLLGGYATNTLTEGERTALFEAALDDQELFDALQNEDALRELLSDPQSREQIQQALRTSARGRSSWMPRAWWLGAFGFAAAAAVAIAIFVLPHPHTGKPTTLQVASNQIAKSPVEPQPQPAPVEPPRTTRKKALRSLRRAPASPQLATPPAAGLALPEQGRPIGGAVNGALASPVPMEAKAQLANAIVANAPLYRGPLVRYSVLHSGPDGNMIRLEIVSRIAGHLALYRKDAAGQWQRTYPASAPDFPIEANTAYQIPDNPLAVPENQERLRLVIRPVAVASEPSRDKALDKTAAPLAPLVVEIPIGPNQR